MRRSSELLIRVDRSAETPLTRQLFERLRAAIHDGRLRPGDPLPASRRFAETLDVSRTVVINAYDQLRQEGYLDARHGSGTFVREPPALAPANGGTAGAPARAAGPAPPPVAYPPAPALAPVLRITQDTRERRGDPRRRAPARARHDRTRRFIDFSPAIPAIDRFPMRQWRGFVDGAYARAATGTLGYGYVDGVPRLREEVARRVRLTRAIPIGPDRVVITSSASSALGILARQLFAPGDVVAVEDPCHPGIPEIMRGGGVTVLPVAVDESGIRVDALVAESARRPIKAVYVTPAHHFPTGARLAQTRRHRLLAWARAHGALIIEHDYDDEFCFGGPRAPALASLAPDLVAYVASFNKTMFPALRVGHVVLPADRRADFVRTKRIVDPASANVDQTALADFIGSGAYARHLKAMRTLYHGRSVALREALDEHGGGLLVPPAETAGLHMYVRRVPDVPESDLLARALAHGVGVYSGAACRLREPDGPAGAHLVMGFGCVPPAQISEGVRRLARALRGRPPP